MPLSSAGFFCLRTPLLPFDRLLELTDGVPDRAAMRGRLSALLERADVQEALYLASPSLFEAIAPWRADPAGDRGARAERGFYKYLARLASRPTPFGLFAAVATGVTGRETALRVAPSAECRRHTRLDNAWLAALARHLEADPGAREAARYRPNDSLRFVAGQGRYAEVRPGPDGDRYHLVSVDETPALAETLARAAGPGGASRAELADALVDGEITRDEALAFVDELIDAQLLLGDLAVQVTGPEPAGVLAARLAAIPACAGAARRLHDAVAALARLDAGAPGQPPARYRELAADLATLPVPLDPARLVQVDLVRPDAGTLGEAALAELRRGVELLHRITPAGEDPLARFTRAFEERYQGRAVPLLEAVDPEVGLGAILAPAGDASPLLHGLPLTPAGPERLTVSGRERHLLHQAGRALAEGWMEWRLDGRDLERLAVPDPLPLAADLAVIATLAARDAGDVARGEFTLHLPYAVPGAARYLGRFCHADPALHRHVVDHLRRQDARHPDRIHAEVVHLPEGRLGNILVRPLLREWEVTFLGRSGAPEAGQLPASDLLLTAGEEGLELWSARLGRRVVPSLSTAHNTTTGLAAYQLLALLEAQGQAPMVGWDWGPAVALPFLPRVSAGRLVLALARWTLSADEIASLRKGSEAQRAGAVQEFRARRRLPRWVTIVEGDHRLPIDLDNTLAVDTLLHELGERDGAILEELWPDPGQLPARGPEGSYRHELLVPLQWEQPAAAGAPARKAPVDGGARRFAPGSEWLYLKLYTHPTEAEAILREVVSPLVARWRKRGWLAGWFFIRYTDPEDHLRLRFRGEPAALWRKVWPALERALAARVATGAVHRLALDTYEREVERYGGAAAMPWVERLFEADSEAAVALLESFEAGDAGLDEAWRLALAGADRWFADLGLPLPERLRQLERSRRYGAVPAPDAALRHLLTARFREHRAAVEALLDPAADHGALAPGLAILAERSAGISEPVAALRALAAAGELTVPLAELAGSVVHMWCNRLLRGAPNAHETVLYDFLRRVYEGRVARG